MQFSQHKTKGRHTMRQCKSKTCGVVLTDADTICPVCGGETMEAGTMTKKRAYEDAPELPIVRVKRGSRIMALITLIIGAAIIYYAYEHFTKPIAPNPLTSGPAKESKF